jgi:hypothetical protein
MTKSFKIARKPEQLTPEAKEQIAGFEQQEASPATIPTCSTTTRKTIEVPEEYFYQVKLRALQRHMKEKELWAEILREYFNNHPCL